MRVSPGMVAGRPFEGESQEGRGGWKAPYDLQAPGETQSHSPVSGQSRPTKHCWLSSHGHPHGQAGTGWVGHRARCLRCPFEKPKGWGMGERRGPHCQQPRGLRQGFSYEFKGQSAGLVPRRLGKGLAWPRAQGCCAAQPCVCNRGRGTPWSSRKKRTHRRRGWTGSSP